MLQVGVKTGYTIRSELSLGCREGLQVLRYCKAEKGSGATVSLNECHTCRHENQQSRNPTGEAYSIFFPYVFAAEILHYFAILVNLQARGNSPVR